MSDLVNNDIEVTDDDLPIQPSEDKKEAKYIAALAEMKRQRALHEQKQAILIDTLNIKMLLTSLVNCAKDEESPKPRRSLEEMRLRKAMGI